MSKRILMKFIAIAVGVLLIATQLFGISPVLQSSAAIVDYFSPFDVAYSPDGSMIAVSDITKAKLNIITASTGAIAKSIQLNGKPKGIAWNGNTRVYAAEYDARTVAEIDPTAGTVLNRITTGPKPSGVAISNGKLVVTDFGMKKVTIVDLATRNILGDVAVKDYPYFVDITTDGVYAIVGHATPSGNAMATGFASSVTFVNIAARTVTSNITLPMGSTNVRAIKCSPDGKWAYVAHTLGRITLPTTQITKGWVNTDALTIIDVANKNLYTTVLLDTLMEGAANPWGLTISSDSNTLYVSISGTHQVYKVDLYNLHQLLLGNIPGATQSGPFNPNYQYKLINRTSGKVLDVPGGNPANGTQLIQYTDNGGNNQKWTITTASTGYYYIKSVGTSKNLDNAGLTTESAPIVEWDASGSNNQQWSAVDMGSGYYKFICRTGGKALDNAGSTTDGTGIVQKTSSTSNNQQWQVVKVGGTDGPDLLYRSKAAYSKPYSDVWFAIKADSSKKALLKNDLGALWSAGLLTKIKMPGQGPRGLSIAPNGLKIAVGAYFAGMVYMLDTATNTVTQTISLGTQPAEDSVRRGERTFHDASTTTQKWLSCATCHPEGRTDGLNWDMPNDGVGNSKNTKSMYKVFETPPAMWRGVRSDAAAGIDAGFRYIKFKTPTQGELDDVAAYIQSFTEEVSPFRNADGSMTADAIAGKAIFESAATQCATCHTGSNLTNLQIYDVGTKDQWDIDGNYVTPPIAEMWRAAPYLHDGSAATMMDVLTTKNVGDKHGKTSQLTGTQLTQLEAYLLQVTAGVSTPAANIALNKTASADSSQTANPAASGNDGSTTTRWCANDSGLNHYWMVNLGGKFNLSSTEVTWEMTGKTYKYKIETSPDNITWSTASDKTANTNTSQVQTDTFTANNVQYVRITVTGLDAGVWASFFEFKVFGT